MAIAAKFKKDSEGYVEGVPARDLTDEEFAALTDQQKAMVEGSGVYDLRRDAPKEAAAATRRIARDEPDHPANADAPSTGGGSR